MSIDDEQVVEDGVFEDVTPTVALVPVASPPRGAPGFVNPRPDPGFVAQLIATAERLPQTRDLRRAAPADAMSAYRAGQRSMIDAGLLTRHVA
jgi:hypothetical protein